jgi:hypothetical protein
MDCFVAPLLAMTSEYGFAFSPRDPREFCFEPSAFRTLEGAGNAERSDSARSLVCEMKKHTSIVATVTPETPGIPRAMVLTVSSALSPVTGLSCHRRPRKLPSANLTPASGCQDHTTSPSARQALSSAAPPTSTASRLAFVTIASRPSEEAGRGELVEMICPTAKAENFFEQDWTAKISLICLKKFRFPRKCHCPMQPHKRTP